MSAFFRTLREELRILVSEPRLWFTGIVVPLFWAVVLAGIFAGGLMRSLPVGLVDADNSPESRELIAAVEALPSVDFVRFESPAAAQDQLKANRICALFTIPANWAAKKAASRSDAALELHLNRGLYAIASTLEQDFKLALADYSKNALLRQAAKTGGGLHGAAARLNVVGADIVLTGNSTVNYLAYLPATLIPGVLALACILTCAGVLTREWRRGTLALWLADGREHFRDVALSLLGRLSVWMLVYAVFALGYVAWFAGWEGWAPQGSLALWCLAAVLLMLAMGGFALFVSAVMPSWIMAVSACICLCAPTFPFTGFSYPLDSMDAGAQALGAVLPLTWFLRAQSAQWILASPLDHSLYLTAMMALLALVPGVIGLTVLARKLPRLAGKAPELPKSAAGPITGFWRTALLPVLRGLTMRDTFAIFAGAVLFYLVFYAWPYSNQQITDVPTAVVDLDRSPVSRSIIEKFRAHPMTDVVVVTSESAQAEDLWRRERVAAVITIEPEFGAFLAAGRPTAIRMTANGAFPVKGRAVLAAFSGIVTETGTAASALALARAGTPGEVLKSMARRPPALVIDNLYNVVAGYAGYIVPVVMPVIEQAVLSMGLMLILGAFLTRYRTDPLARAVLGSHRGITAFLVGFWLFGMVWFLYAVGLDFALFDYTSLVNASGTIIVGALFVAGIVLFASAGTLLLNSNAYGPQFFVVISAPSVFLSGMVFPSYDFSLLARLTALLLPSTPSIQALVACSQNGAALHTLMPELAHLCALCLFWGLLVYWLAARRRLERQF
ncbi:MAG: ABC transporter permease [Duodenibacillus sp.]